MSMGVRSICSSHQAHAETRFTIRYGVNITLPLCHSLAEINSRNPLYNSLHDVQAHRYGMKCVIYYEEGTDPLVVVFSSLGRICTEYVSFYSMSCQARWYLTARISLTWNIIFPSRNFASYTWQQFSDNYSIKGSGIHAVYRGRKTIALLTPSPSLRLCCCCCCDGVVFNC